MRTKTFSLAAVSALAVAALSSGAPASATELITNGGFQTGNFSGWTQGGNLGFTSVGCSAGFGQASTCAASLGPIGSNGTLSQTIATVVGNSYLFSFGLRNLSGGRPNDFTASFGGAPVFTLVDAGAFGFTTYSFTQTATSASTVVNFSFQHDPSFFRLDNVSVMGVPEPMTWAMMILGFGVIGGAMRRRKASVATSVRYA